MFIIFLETLPEQFIIIRWIKWYNLIYLVYFSVTSKSIISEAKKKVLFPILIRVLEFECFFDFFTELIPIFICYLCSVLMNPYFLSVISAPCSWIPIFYLLSLLHTHEYLFSICCLCSILMNIYFLSVVSAPYSWISIFYLLSLLHAHEYLFSIWYLCSILMNIYFLSGISGPCW